MTPPRTLWRVEWTVCRHPDAPNDRKAEARNFATAERAGEQVCSVRMWEPIFATLIGVWRSTGWRGGELEWTQIDPESLPITAGAEYRYGAIASGDPYKEMMQP